MSVLSAGHVPGVDYADGLARVGVQSAAAWPEAAELDSKIDDGTRPNRAAAQSSYRIRLHR